MESLDNSRTAPADLLFALLQNVTNGFSDDHKIGSGGYGDVYKGVLENGEEIAVKKLHDMPGLNDVQFKNEFNNLMRVQHENIVRLVGYCYEIRHKLVKHNGENILARVEERALCFEYMQGGSLDNHLSDESCGLDWQTRYKIIKGICEGLNYLHRGCHDPIYHLDLKPGNILLGENMIPKIGDFGLSRLFASSQTYATKIMKGTINYMPPEYLSKRHISEKFDIFSLGVVIVDIMTGHDGFSKYGDIPAEEFIVLVYNNWRKRIELAPLHREIDCQQVKRCIEIALKCLEVDKGNRPTIGDIIQELKEIDTMINGTMEGAGEEKDEKSREPVVHKDGPWGGNGGKIIDIKVPPHRLKSVTVYSGALVDSLSFSYIDHSGNQHNVGQWGGPWVGPGGFTIELQPSEVLLEICGTVGPFVGLSYSNVIKSLTLITNEDRYGPFGHGGGRAFRSQIKDNFSIVGFFVRASNVIHGIGVYMNPILHIPSGGKVMPWQEGEEEE